MYTHAHKHHVPIADLFRWTGRACAITLVITWLVFVFLEILRSGLPTATASVGQAAILAVVFVGYAVGRRAEFVGGVIAILGTVLFFAVSLLANEVLPHPEALWFAAPGILYLLAWNIDGRPHAKWLRDRTKRV